MTDVRSPSRSTHSEDRRSPSVFKRIEQRVCAAFGCAPTVTDTSSPSTPGLIQIGMPSSSASVGLAAVALSKTYADGTVAASDVSLEARPGEIVSVLGPNGAGKSTVLNMMAGLLTPSSGRATANGISTTDPRRLATQVGVALQSSGLDPSMTGAEHVQVQGALYGMTPEAAEACGRELLEIFGLTPYRDRAVANYSIGLQRRLSLALSMVHDPSTIILDEPTAGLDPQSRRLTWDLMQQLSDQGRTILFSTQILEEADLLADRVYVISGGRVVDSGTPAELRSRYGHRVVRMRPVRSRDDLEAWATTTFPGQVDVSLGPDSVAVVPTGADLTAAQILTQAAAAETVVAEASIGSPTLEDAFVGLVGATLHTEPLQGEVQNRGIGCRCS